MIVDLIIVGLIIAVAVWGYLQGVSVGLLVLVGFGAGTAGMPRRARARGSLRLTVLCVLVVFGGCGGGDGERRDGARQADRAGATGVTDCLRDSGATVEEGPLYSFPGAAIANYEVALKSGGSASVEVFRSETHADGRLTSGPVAARKGKTVVLYGGSAPDEATLLEGCLRSSGTGEEPRRGQMARRVREDRARFEEGIRRQRQRSYSAPAAITDVLVRLAGYRRYTLYYPGRAVGRLPLELVGTRLTSPAYESTTRRPPPLISPAFSFLYGSCEPPPGTESGCAPPLSVENSEICARNPSSYGFSPAALPERIRGVPVLRKDQGRSLELFTGHTTISISAGSPDILALAITNLRALDGTIGPRGKLPPPVPGALEGQLRCRRPTKIELDGAP
ncbi:MAG: hypothetical protein M3356_04790 [Actinomycetota bacterium]|nr:hypothetical protein [Actinomycetota bacterium]